MSLSETTFISGKEDETSRDEIEDVSQVVGGVLGDDADVVVGWWGTDQLGVDEDDVKHDAGAGQDDPTGVETLALDGDQFDVGIVDQVGGGQVVEFTHLGPDRT